MSFDQPLHRESTDLTNKKGGARGARAESLERGLGALLERHMQRVGETGPRAIQHARPGVGHGGE